MPRDGMVWSGWRQSANQDVEVGFWSVPVPADESGRDVLISTTLGSVQRIREFEMFDMMRYRDWPCISSRSTDSEKETVKARALKALQDALHAA